MSPWMHSRSIGAWIRSSGLSRLAFGTLCAGIVALTPSVSSAASIEYREGGGTGGHTGIYLKGEIKAGDLARLEKAWLEAVDKSPLALIPAEDEDSMKELVGEFPAITLFLLSDGGDAEEAFAIGRFVHHVFIRTVAPDTNPIIPNSSGVGDLTGDGSFVCASSCAFIWLAGRWRDGDRVAFHRPFEMSATARRSDELDTSMAAIRDITKSYLTDIGVDERIFPAIMSQSRDEAMTLSELQQVADVPVYSPAFEELIIDACQLSASELERLRKSVVGGRSVEEIDQAADAYREALRCARWELAKLQVAAWRDAPEAAGTGTSKVRLLLLAVVGLVLLILAVAAWRFWRRRRAGAAEV